MTFFRCDDIQDCFACSCDRNAKEHIPTLTHKICHMLLRHFSMSTNPCINKAIHMLLMHSFGTLNTKRPLFWASKLETNGNTIRE